MPSEPHALRLVGATAAGGAWLARAATVETLEDVLHAGFDVVEVVVQDEYTHDVITRGGGPGFVVFDTT